MIEKEVVSRIAEEQLALTGCFLVDVTIKPGNQIVVEIDHDIAVGIDDCVALSRYIEERIDREIEDYELEVGSSGIGTPFKMLRQYRKNLGREVEVLFKTGLKLKGVLKSVDEGGITLSTAKKGSRKNVEAGEEQTYSYNEIKYTKTIIRFN